MPTNYFDDEDGTDDQISTLQNAESDKKESTEYQPVVAPKSAFMDREFEVGQIIPMRVEAIHDDEVVLVCDDEGEGDKDEEPQEEEAEPEGGGPGGPPTDYFD